MIFVWGSGSIGRRHLVNLTSLSRGKIGLISRNPHKQPQPTTNLHGIWSPGEVNWKTVSELIIATPTSFHLSHLETALHGGVKKIYLEKPISHNNDRIEEISSLIKLCGAKVFVGFDLRYDPGLVKVKELVQKQALGMICSVHAHVGQYLPDWRPDQDYRQSMSASFSLGGGVMLDLTHEIDYLLYLFGDIALVANSNGHRSNLEIETEDTSDSLLQFQCGISGTVHLDYLQKLPTRYLHIIGSDGALRLDLLARKLVWNSSWSSEQNTFDYSKFERNDRFRSILSDFISTNPSDRLCSWAEGKKTLNVVVESKLASTQMQIRRIFSS